MTLLAIVAIHTAANEPPKVRQVMNKIHRNVGVSVPLSSTSAERKAWRKKQSARSMPSFVVESLISRKREMTSAANVGEVILVDVPPRYSWLRSQLRSPLPRFKGVIVRYDIF